MCVGVCVFVVEVFEVCGRLPDGASVSEVHISNSEAAADKFNSHWCTYDSPPRKVQNTKILLTEASILTNVGVTSLITTYKGDPNTESRGRGRLFAPLFV
jgi:hypothetical protein